jgi:CRP-like cAMP-binding protein
MLTAPVPTSWPAARSRVACPAPPGCRLESRHRAVSADAPVRNNLLAALAPADLAHLRPRLERVPLRRRQVLQERNVPLCHAYFLESGAASLLSRTGQGESALEVGLLGRADLAGTPIVLGTGRSPHRCVVQVPGEALRIGAEDLRDAMRESPALQGLLLAYVQTALVQSSQIAACNARHSLRERLARWLLVAHDRLGTAELPLTHLALGRALGVRRAGVTTAMGALEEAGLVRKGRGRILLLDRSGLEAEACDCARTIRAEQHRLLCTDPFNDRIRA